MSLWLSYAGTHSLIPEDDLPSLLEIRRKSGKLIDQRNAWQEVKCNEEKKKKAEEKSKNLYMQDRRKINVQQREIKLFNVLYNIERKKHEASLTEDELKEERLDKFFALTEQLLAKKRYKQYQLVETQYLKQFEIVPYE